MGSSELGPMKTEFATDSPLEGDGFELSVPRDRLRFKALSLVGRLVVRRRCAEPFRNRFPCPITKVFNGDTAVLKYRPTETLPLRPPRPPSTAGVAEVEAQKSEAFTSLKVDYAALFIIDFNLQLAELLPKSFVHCPNQPVSSRRWGRRHAAKRRLRRSRCSDIDKA